MRTDSAAPGSQVYDGIAMPLASIRSQAVAAVTLREAEEQLRIMSSTEAAAYEAVRSTAGISLDGIDMR